MKKTLALVLALAMTLSLTLVSFAGENTLSVNGTAVKNQTYQTNYIPFRAFAEADLGRTIWYQEKNTCAFYLVNDKIEIDFATLALSLNGKKETVDVKIVDGVTYIHKSIFDKLDGCKVTSASGVTTITTPNNSALTKLAYSLRKKADIEHIGRTPSYDMSEYHGLTMANYDEIICFTPMIIQSYTLYVAKASNMANAEKEFKAVQDNLIKSYEHYMPEQGKMAQDGKIIKQGDYIMLIISQNNDKAIEAFKSGVKDIK